MQLPPSISSGEPALSILVLLPASAHMAQNASPIAPLSRPAPLTSRKSGSTVPSLKSLNAPQQPSRLRYDDHSPDGDRANIDPMDSNQNIALPGRRASLAPGLGAGTEIRGPEGRVSSRLGTIESSPPSTPDRSPSPSPDEVASSSTTNSALDAYRFASSVSTTAAVPEETTISIPVPTLPPAASEAPAFGSRKPLSSSAGNSGRSRRRPQTAATSGGIGQSTQRGSMALPSGTGLGMGAGPNSRNRPGWEADEVVTNLRAGGLEAADRQSDLVNSHSLSSTHSPSILSPSATPRLVALAHLIVTIIRNTSQLPSLLSSNSGSPSFPPSISARPSRVTSVTPVILIPLCDSPSIPSLSLLLAQGTTPTAVCFQQDLLERARQTEDEWLPAALDQIKAVVSMRNQTTSSTYEAPIILVYSANPALYPSTTQRCIAAGASGVLKPPFHGESARLVKRMVRAARAGRISSVVELPVEASTNLIRAPGTLGRAAIPSYGQDGGESGTKVVLPPTALDMGGEHEGEKVLSAAMTHRRQNSYTNGGAATTQNRHPALSLDGLPPVDSLQIRDRRQDLSIVTPTTAMPNNTPPSTTDTHQDSLHPYIASLSRYRPSCTPRRRSVDIGCLSVALSRATSAFEGPLSIMDAKQGFTFPPPIPDPAEAGTAAPSMKRGRTQASKSELRRTSTVQGPVHDCAGHEEESSETHLAELLSAMYCQSTAAMDVEMSEYERLSAPMSPSHRKRLVDSLATWNFKPHELDDGDLFRVATLLFEAVIGSEGLAELGIEQDQMNRLLYTIRAIYHAPNPYHNYVHAIDVLQATYSFLLDIGVVPPHSFLLEPEPRAPWQRPDEAQKPVCGVGTRRAREVLRPQDVLAVLVAAMGHDVGHPGLSNAFMKNAKTPLSEVYDDKSVLENMHCMLIKGLLRRHGFYFLICPSAASKRSSTYQALSFRRVMYSSVLATDMSLHFAWIARLKEFGSSIETHDESSEEDDRIMLCQAIIKCADISNPTRPIDVSEHWSSVLLEEWAKQASLEQDLDLPVSVVASADAALQAKGQIGFIDLFTQPLFAAVSEILPELHGYANSCAENRSLWQTRLDGFVAQPDSQRIIVQPAIEDASADERFRLLIPLLLPTSLADSLNQQSSITEGSFVQSPSGPTTSISEDVLTPPISNSSVPHASDQMTPNGYTSTSTTTSTNTESPSTKAMRAVYHTNLLEHRHRLCTWVGGDKVGVPIPGVGGFDLDFDRRMSTPSGV